MVVAKIVRGGQTGSLDHINSSQATFRAQISALTDAVRQLGGNPEIGAGAIINDPLNAPYVLYVNPYTGNDTFVGGNYSTNGTATQRIELQRLECGYSEARPFKTINRAIIEAGIITAKSFYESPLTNNDLVSIVLAPGVYTVYNGTGAASVTEWATGKSPTTDELTEFNTNTTGGVILPRGVSLCGLDLRKTIFRPHSVPSIANEAADASNRRTIFKVTGTGYYFGFTFMDKAGSTASHHLLHAFEFASQSELDEFYTKIRQAFGGTNNTGGLSNALAVTKTTEYEIVGPQPTSGSQTISTDTTLSASPYIFNCSIRSNYGLCGVYADGAKTSGFRSLVIAQFTGVSLQRDLNCWQKYDNGQDTKWSSTYFTNYADYISTPPNNVRMDPARRSFHIRAVNNAVIQEVSVFAIGQGIHHWTQTGGEITITNSNSNFGGCAAVSEGYRTASTAADANWNVSKIRVASNLTDKTSNIQRIYLGTIQQLTSTTLTLSTPLGDSATTPGVPDLVASRGYTLRSASRVWVENPLGTDWSSTFTGNAWSATSPSVLNITAALQDESGNPPDVIEDVSSAIGKRVYIRRFVDTRSPDERRYSLKLNNTAQGARTPVRDYVLQTNTDSNAINSLISDANILLVANSVRLPAEGQGVYLSAEISLRRGNTSSVWASNKQYKRGDTVKYNGKHYTATKDNADTVFDAAKWDESYVHMSSEYNPEDFYKNEGPILVFDNDTSNLQESLTLGYNLSGDWTTDATLALVRPQYQEATDYKGLHLFLTSLGFSSAQAHTILRPQAPVNRDRDPSSNAEMSGYVPSGAANSQANWPIEFRRPSVIRLFGHAWEWTGYLNYTKAIPSYQGELSPQNKFTYYFTNVNGGRVYATGFNEEGYQVTPRGLEDVTTGVTLTVESLGASDITIDDRQTTDFDALTANRFTVNNQLSINGNVSLAPNAATSLKASTTAYGIGQIASIADLNAARAATSDSTLNTGDANFVTPGGLLYLTDSRYAPILSANAKRLFVLPTGASLPANASSYPLINNAGTINLNNVTTFPTIQAAYASLPLQFTLAEGDHIDIYLLADTVDLGTITTNKVVGSLDPDKLTYIIPNDWQSNSRQQIVRYTLSDSYELTEGPFYNCVFFTRNPYSAPVAVKGRFKLEVTATPVTTGDPRIIGVVGRNIDTTNMHVQLTLSSSDTVRRTFRVFNGATLSPYTTYFRHNERAVYFKFSLEGNGSQIRTANTNDTYYYDVVLFTASTGCPIRYGSAMCQTSTIAGLSTDEDRRLATAYFEFENNRAAAARMLFHSFKDGSSAYISGAGYSQWTSSITWALRGAQQINWRLFGFESLGELLDGSSCPSVTAKFLTSGLTCQSWGGFINATSSTRAHSTAHSPGAFNFVQSELSNWGLFGAGGNVTASNSLLGADGSGYYLRPNASRYSIVEPSS